MTMISLKKKRLFYVRLIIASVGLFMTYSIISGKISFSAWSRNINLNSHSICDVNNTNVCINYQCIVDNSTLQMFADILEKKLSAVTIPKLKNFKPTCFTPFLRANSCDNNTCLQTELPESLLTRVTQLVTPRKLQMTQREHKTLREMANKVTGNYDIILLTATSSSHYLESEALLQNLHQNVYPYLENFTIVIYNLGLSKTERSLMVKYCRCQVMDFPFDKFPAFMTTLYCYSWKPVLIKAHLQKANLVFWMDASVRFKNSSTNLLAFIQGAREKGVRLGFADEESSFRTYRSMYHFFGDEPCAYFQLNQAQSTMGVYHREYFIDRVILEPWVACALNKDCMCPDSLLRCGRSRRMAHNYRRGKGPIIYGLCHRFDQSGISLILHKLYQDYFDWLPGGEGDVLGYYRRHHIQYFPKE